MTVQVAPRHRSGYKIGDDMRHSSCSLFSLPCRHLMYFIVPRLSFRTKRLFHKRSFLLFVAAAFVLEQQLLTFCTLQLCSTGMVGQLLYCIGSSPSHPSL
jgi:hypothetical protein